MVEIDLALNALVAGVLLGGFYAAVSLGLAVAFGQLDVVNIAHPAFVILGSYIAYWFNSTFGWDPLLAGVLFAPIFFVVGMVIYCIAGPDRVREPCAPDIVTDQTVCFGHPLKTGTQHRAGPVLLKVREVVPGVK